MNAAEAQGSTLAPGYELDRYELLCPIAEGGMASVWIARQRGKHGFEKLVAIKTILPKFATDPRFQQMFLDEARIASRIEHPNVAQILDLGEENAVLYLAMEYVDGEALSKLNRACQRKGETIPVGVLLRVLADTCAGLHEAHELKDAGGKRLDIVHRDVSPHNVLVSNKGVAKLIDFGIAKARSRVGSDTNSGVLKGKIQYMAPEQALAHPVDHRADLWAIGAILYHVLSGKPAFEGENQLATLHLLGSGRPPAPLPDAVHPAIRDVARKALAFAPEKRHATAAELRDAIEDAMIEAMVPTTNADVAAFASRHLAERIDKRKQAIDVALAAAADRDRIRDLLKPPTERTSSGIITSSIRPPSPSSSRPMAAMSDPRASSPLLAGRVAPGVSEPPPNAQSLATLGSAALDASMPPPRTSRKGLVAAVGLIVAGAATATVVSFTMFRGAPQSAAARGAPTASAATVSPVPSASAPTPAASSAIPTIAASSLPKAAPTPPPPPRWVPPPSPAPSPQARKSTKGTIDDGF